MAFDLTTKVPGIGVDMLLEVAETVSVVSPLSSDGSTEKLDPEVIFATYSNISGVTFIGMDIAVLVIIEPITTIFISMAHGTI